MLTWENETKYDELVHGWTLASYVSYGVSKHFLSFDSSFDFASPNSPLKLLNDTQTHFLSLDKINKSLPHSRHGHNLQQLLLRGICKQV